MSPVQYKELLRRYVRINFATQYEAAEFFDCSPTTLSLVMSEDRSPTDGMLEATGHKRLRVNKISYVKDESI